ncbi:hypothetical protein MAIT1_00169 [Magnetofaba australis IT-1]|uniref:Uncharacterized protein n=1 Tax=Magnetofaba australis IT-1 TaxID=1434232 RepID=A0A1Y2K8D4_9PROT|nr:hypothetical protein MAIT1_00169 [Magnetofaba australis IT-1]
MRAVAHRLGGQLGEDLGVDLEHVAAFEGNDAHPLLSKAAVFGLIGAGVEHLYVAEFGHDRLLQASSNKLAISDGHARI